MRFRLAPKSMTLVWRWTWTVQIFSEFCANSHFWEATTCKRMNIDRHCQRRIVAHWKYFSAMYRLRWYCWAFLRWKSTIKIQWAKMTIFNLSKINHQGCRALKFSLARLSCIDVSAIRSSES